MRRTVIALHATAAGASLAILAPALAPGYVLAYDMVFTPRIPFTADTVGLGSGLPRAVPQDAVVAALSVLVRGDVLQKVALVAAIYLAVLGAARLVPAERTLTRLVAGLAYGWNAYVAERLFIGHWSLLLAYAALPWIARAALAARRGGPVAPVIGWSALAALTPTGGLLALGVAGVLLLWPVGRDSPGLDLRRWGAVAGIAVLNAPWLVAGFLATGAGRSDPAGVAAFVARSENWSGAIGSLLGLGGVWNRQVVPASRESIIAPVLTLLMLATAAWGIPALRRRCADFAPVVVVAVGGLALAVLGVVPGGQAVLRWLVEVVPGAGLLRDGQKFLAPFALLVAVAFALGAERVAERLTAGPARVVLAGALLLPVIALPDLAWGGLGRLVPVQYPADWDRVAAEVEAAPDGELVALPFSAFRAYRWNGERTSLDPTPRQVPAPVLVDDRLVVGSRVLAGESVRSREVREALDSGQALAGTGVRWVLVQHGTPGDVPESALAGLRVAYDGDDLTLYENPAGRRVPDATTAARFALTTAYVLALVVAARQPRDNGSAQGTALMPTPW